MNYKIGQYFNLSGSYLVLKHILRRTQPDFKMNSVADLSTDFLSFNEIKFIILDKDNTITLPYEDNIYNEEIKLSISKIVNYIGLNSIIVVSNSQGSSDDTSSKKNIIPRVEYDKNLGLNVYMHGCKKPNIIFKNRLKIDGIGVEFSSNIRELEDNSIKNIRAQNVLVIGDRLMIDVYMAKENNFKSLLVNQLTYSKENVFVKFIRKIEKLLLK